MRTTFLQKLFPLFLSYHHDMPGSAFSVVICLGLETMQIEYCLRLFLWQILFAIVKFFSLKLVDMVWFKLCPVNADLGKVVLTRDWFSVLVVLSSNKWNYDLDSYSAANCIFEWHRLGALSTLCAYSLLPSVACVVHKKSVVLAVQSCFFQVYLINIRQRFEWTSHRFTVDRISDWNRTARLVHNSRSLCR